IDPMEDEEGIDFWWIDWQQWQESPEMDGLDPLWALNHLHALDRTRDGRRPFILSRWSELGGHRYQVGFSGDAVVSWDSLRFQPYLTAASANVEFGWWSHDVGGHMCGVGDPDAFGELYARWAQFGALSPINRIHTTKTPSIDKRPWQYDGATYDAIADSLRLRHRLVPYLYTMSWRDHADSRPLVRPMYFRYPETEAAYHCPHQYYFGSELLVAPHLSPLDDDTNLSRRSVWLPGGPETDEADAGDGPAGGAPDEWVDFFTGERYDPGFHARYGDLDDLPVYAPAGAVVPLGPEVGWGGIDNPVRLEVVAVPGADGEFTLFEDDGETLAHRDGEYATTRMALEDDGDAATFAVEPAEGDLSEIPGERDYAISFRGVVEPDDVTVDADVDALDVSYREETETAVVELTGVDVTDGLAVIVETDSASLTDTRDRTEERAEDLLRHFEMPVVAEDRLRGVTLGETESAENLWDPESFDWLTDFLQALTASQRRAVFETLTGAGVDLLDHDGDERAVVWNRDEREDVTYRYTAWDTGALHHEYGGESDRGVAPAFGVFELGRDDVDAEVSVTYDGLATVACESPPDEG
ncbi:MAG: TIM-barrel domain-containing protein, partial [Haloarculaceae archaeon]